VAWQDICEARKRRLLVQGTDVMIFKIFSAKKIAKKLSYDKAKLRKFLIITFVFENNAIFSTKIGKNRRKL
jgi:hypothetical protein